MAFCGEGAHDLYAGGVSIYHWREFVRYHARCPGGDGRRTANRCDLRHVCAGHRRRLYKHALSRAINNRGQILFGARIFDHNGYWLESSPGQVGKLAVDGNRAPGLAFKTFNSLAGGPVSLNDNGDSLVSFGFSPFPVNPYTPHANGVGDGLWVTSGGSGGLNLLAADGLPVPGLSSPNILLLQQNSRLNQAGQVAFLTFAGDGIGSDVWVDSLGQTSRHVTQAPAHAPGTPSGANFQNFGSLLVSDAGRVAFDARLTAGSGGVTSSNNSGLWQETPAGDLRLVAALATRHPASRTRRLRAAGS